MKSIKAKLFASVAMLLIAAVLMTSASFAWFTVSTAPEVSPLDVTMTATKNLEIARGTTGAASDVSGLEVGTNDAGDQTKWGGTVTDFEATTLAFPAVYSSGIKTIKYDDTGRTDGFTDAADSWTLTDGQGTIDLDIENYQDDVAVAAVYAVWLRTNTEGEVKAEFDGNKDDDGNVENTFLKVYALVDDTYTELSGTAATIATIDDDDSTAIATDTAFKVEIIVFFDGTSMYAADVAEDMLVDDIEVSFSNSNIT